MGRASWVTKRHAVIYTLAVSIMSNTRVFVCFVYFHSINEHFGRCTKRKQYLLNAFQKEWEICRYWVTIRLRRTGEKDQLAGMHFHSKTFRNRRTDDGAHSNFQNVLNELTWDDQTVLLQKTVQSPILEKYPLQVKYVIRFLRHIIDALESRNAEIHDELYEIFCDYQAKGTQLDHTDYSYKHYHINNDEENVTITLKENHNIISQGTTGLNVWEAALAMCEWSLNNVTSICGKHVLELGAGTGLSGLVIGKCCQPASITLTDGDDNVLDYLDENVRNNFERNERDNYFRGQTSVGM